MERFEINSLSTWLNERGKDEAGKKARRSRILCRVGNEKLTWLAGKNALVVNVRIRNKASVQETN